jgi:hypothetical protein
VDIRRRPINPAAVEARERTVRIRAAARKGKTTGEIAEVYGFPLKMVEHILAPIADVRLSDPMLLLNNGAVPPGGPAGDVQVYWVGFLTAAGQICGQGASLALIITLGDRSQEHVDTFMADLATSQVRHEFCRSSLLGWQLYVRDQSLCKVLLRWGVPSGLHGDDPALLDDLPKHYIAPFLRGYLDGDGTAPGATQSKSNGLVFRGTEPVLAAINTMIRRGWGTGTGVVTPRQPRSELRFNRRDEQTILNHIQAYTTRSRSNGKRKPA